MTIAEVRDILQAELLTGEELLNEEIHSACGSDLMSDVLAFVKEQGILLTGLMNLQTIRTAEMMDMKCVVFVRGKKPNESILSLAEDSGIAVLCTGMRLYSACGKLYVAGLIGPES